MILIAIESWILLISINMLLVRGFEPIATWHKIQLIIIALPDLFQQILGYCSRQGFCQTCLMQDVNYFIVRMDPVTDISDIIIAPEEQNNRFLEIKQSSKRLANLECQSFVKIFYGKKSMRELLDERTNLCLQLQLSSKKANERQQIDKETMAYRFSQLFFDCPDQLNQFSWAIIQDKSTVYGFIATQNKFAPLCKSCNHAIYVSMRFNLGRVVCGNPKCKIKLLGEFEIGHKINASRKQIQKTENASSHILRKSELAQGKSSQIQLGVEQKQLIKKAAKRLVN